MKQLYLGNSVYVRVTPERDGCELYLVNGVDEKNHIYLEPDVLNALFKFVKEYMA